MTKKKCKVSIFCLAYNHDKYIRKTLEGFINQKTNFEYEIIIHDDASNDKTRLIIEEYVKNYPDIITPIFQDKNQYKKDVDIISKYIYPRINGEFIAVCEGDDYWCDVNKLQKQYDFLNSHTEYSLCVHNTVKIDEQGNSLGQLFNQSNIEKDLTTQEIILAGGGGLFHTSSCMYRNGIAANLPDKFKVYRIGDYPDAIWRSLCGRVRYFPEVMSAYRVNSSGSFSMEMARNKEINAKTLLSLIKSLKNFDVYTKKEYHKEFLDVINEQYCHFYFISGKTWVLIFKPKLWKCTFELALKRKKRENNEK